MVRIVRLRGATRALAWTSAFALIGGLVAAATSSPAIAATKAARKGTKTGSPSISITAPSSGSTVSATATVSGAASDTISLSSVAVSIDGGAWQPASGTTSWSYSLNTTSYANGSHTLAAQATDTSGYTATVSETISVQNSTTGSSGSTTTSNGSLSWTDTTLTAPGGAALSTLGRGKQTEWGAVSAVLDTVSYSGQQGVYFRDSSSGASSFVTLPVDTTAGWTNANYVMTSASDLWIGSGDGPIYLRHYTFSGSPLPTSATLVSSQIFGDTDSRHGDVTVLASGAVVLVWHQQGQTGAQGQYIAYGRSGGGSWQVIGPLQFMPSAASKQVVAQHPADKSVWVFSDPDAWAAIGAIHLTEGTSGLSLDWANGTYINTSAYGELGPDPENPDLAVAPDPSTNTLALAYQDDHRYMFSTNPVVTGSYVAVDRITAAGAMSWTELQVYVERVSSIGLVVAPGQTWLVYRPINQSTLTFSELYANCFCNGAWQTAADLGTLAGSYERVGYGVSRVEVSANMSDGNLHFFSVG